MHKAQAFINHGRIIALCPHPKCDNAMMLEAGQPTFHCGGAGGCGMLAPLEWPDNLPELLAALEPRWPKNQNWFPKDHSLAVRSNSPHGQTPEELIEETLAHSD